MNNKFVIRNKLLNEYLYDEGEIGGTGWKTIIRAKDKKPAIFKKENAITYLETEIPSLLVMLYEVIPIEDYIRDKLKHKST